VRSRNPNFKVRAIHRIARGAAERVGRRLRLIGPNLARTCFGDELSLGFEPIGTGVARQRKSMPPFRNEVRAHTDLFIGRPGRFCWRRTFCWLFFRRGRTFLASRLGILPACRCRGRRSLVDLRLGGGRARRGGPFIFVLDNVVFFRHRTDWLTALIGLLKVGRLASEFSVPVGRNSNLT
jgi:hypothetical protein